MRRALAFLIVIAMPASATGCVTVGNGAAQNAIDVNVAPIASTPRTEIRSSGEPSMDGRCTLTLNAGNVEKSSSGCYLDSHVAKVSGTLTYPCSGSGAAEADFGEDHYAGRIDDGRLSLARTTELDWEDGCRWGTHAVLEGTLSKGKPLPSQTVAWTYVDRVVSGDGCSGVCRAHASVEASVNGAAKKEAPED